MSDAKSREVPPNPPGKRWPCRYKECPRTATKKVFSIMWGPVEGVNVCDGHVKYVISHQPGCYVGDTPDICGSGECGHV